eukprot:ANDGO_07810.mRNA.1 hypothetical protein
MVRSSIFLAAVVVVVVVVVFGGVVVSAGRVESASVSESSLYRLSLSGKVYGIDATSAMSAAAHLPEQVTLLLESGSFVREFVVLKDGSFSVQLDVPLEMQLSLTVSCAHQLYAEYQITVPEHPSKSPRVVEFAMGEKRLVKSTSMHIQPLMEAVAARSRFFEVKEAFDWRSVLMNPMTMVLGMTMLMMYMMKNMDPAALKEAQTAIRDIQSGGQTQTPPQPAAIPDTATKHKQKRHH